MFREVITSVSVRKTVHMDTGTDKQLFESPDLTLIDFCLWDWMESKVFERKVVTTDEFLARI